MRTFNPFSDSFTVQCANHSRDETLSHPYVRCVSYLGQSSTWQERSITDTCDTIGQRLPNTTRFPGGFAVVSLLDLVANLSRLGLILMLFALSSSTFVFLFDELLLVGELWEELCKKIDRFIMRSL